MGRKTLKQQVSDLHAALRLMHGEWRCCPWCGKTKHPSAHCACRGWRRRRDRLPALVGTERARNEDKP
jgi:hypothetical protein